MIVVGAAEERHTGIHAGVCAGPNIDHVGDMAGGIGAGMLQRDAEIEDVGVRVEEVAVGVDHFIADRRRVLTGLHIDAATEDDRQVARETGFHQIPLIGAVGRAVEETERMRVTRIGAVHALDAPAPIEGRGR